MSSSTQVWVIKVGSQLVCSQKGKLILSWMRDLAKLQKTHKARVIWVTSGAIATAGRSLYQGPERRSTLRAKQALSALGQPELMSRYLAALKKVGKMGAQVLLTAEDMRHSKRSRLLKQTLFQLLEWGVVPILNENDAVSTAEIEFGDNDQLAAQLAVLVGAKRLLLLSDVAGVVDSSGKVLSRASCKKLQQGQTLKTKDRALVGSFGGMQSKVQAAAYALKHGVLVEVAQGASPQVLLRWANRHPIGTRLFR